jgi:hypothetical protein
MPAAAEDKLQIALATESDLNRKTAISKSRRGLNITLVVGWRGRLRTLGERSNLDDAL